MPASFTAIFTLTRIAAATLTADRFVTLAGAVPAAGAAGVGVLRANAEAGDLIALDVLGTAVVECGGTIADGALVECDAQGRVITKASGTTLGRALSGGASGGKIEVLLFPN